MEIINDELFSFQEIAQILNISTYEAFRRRREYLILPLKIKGCYKYYKVSQFETIHKYYPMKTKETFYIYESKMNN